jgi:hypothetical protein
MRRRAALACVLGGAAAACLGCRRKRRSPEEQVRDSLAALVRAVEKEDLKGVRDLISERYRDVEQHDRQDVLSLLRMYLARHPRVHVAARVTTVTIAAANEARAQVVAALAALTIEAPGDLARAQADVYRFDLTLTEEAPERWVVTRAAWQPAEPGDLFGATPPS